MKATIVMLLALATLTSAVGPATAADLIVEALGETCQTHGNQFDCYNTYTITQQVAVQYASNSYDTQNDTYEAVRGSVNQSNYVHPSESWIDEWTDGTPLRPGVTLTATLEYGVRVSGANGTTAQPVAGDTRPWKGAINATNQRVDGAIPLLSYRVDLRHEKIMSGSSKFYYRSPVLYDETNWTAHYLNFVDSTGRVVVARAYEPTLSASQAPDDALLDDRRVYYHIVAQLDAGKSYQVYEYAKVRSDLPQAIDHLDFLIAPNQDLDGDGLVGLSVFPNTPAQQTTDTMDAAYGFRFVYGIGAGGTMGLYTTPNRREVAEFVSDPVQARQQLTQNNAVHIIVPLRVSAAYDAVVWVYAYTNPAASGEAVASGTVTLPGLTGTISTDVLLNASRPEGVTWYYKMDMYLTIELPSEADCEEGAACFVLSYPMYAGSQHVIKRTGYSGEPSHRLVTRAEWSMWTEYNEKLLEVPEDESATDSASIWAKLAILGSATLALGTTLLWVPYVGTVLMVAGGAMFAVGMTVEVVQGVMRATAACKASEACSNLAKGLFAALPCLGTLAANAIPNPIVKFGAKTALWGACAALLGASYFGSMEGLFDFIADVVTVVQRALEVTGELLKDILAITLWLIEEIHPWVKVVFLFLTVFTTVFFVRETILWLLSLGWLYIATSSPRAKAYYNSVEDLVEGISVPLWDTLMYRHGAIRGRYRRHRSGGNAE